MNYLKMHEAKAKVYLYKVCPRVIFITHLKLPKDIHSVTKLSTPLVKSPLRKLQVS